MPERHKGREFFESVETPPEIEATLKAHIVDREPHIAGRRELIKKMGDASLGAMEVSIGRADPALNVESAVIARGKAKVLVGPNGAGKSTFLDAVMERGAHIETQAGRGAVVIGKSAHIRETTRIARLDQEEMLGRVDDFEAGEVLGQAAKYFKRQFAINWEDSAKYETNFDNQQVHARIEMLMNQIVNLFDMQEFLKTKVKHLSGGERTKLALFMVLLSEADVLLLDEPTNHLDLRSIAKLTALFAEYKKTGTAILSVSHVDWFLRDAGKDGVLEVTWDNSGRTLSESKSPYGDYVKNPTREKVPIISGDIRWIQRDYGYKAGEALIDSPGSFTIPQTPLANIEAPSIHGGELLVLSGDNGSGKTLLTETIVHGTRDGLPRKRKGVKIAYLPQFWPEKVVRGSIGEFFQWVKDDVTPHAKGSAEHPEQSAQRLFLRRVGELSFGGAPRAGEQWLRRSFAKLSGGEQRILWFIAASSLRDVDMLALDEPTNHMDRSLQEKVTRTIRSFPGAVLLSTHDRNLIEALSEDGGKLRGAIRRPTHYVLEKKEGKSRLISSQETPAEYLERIMREAIQQAKKFKV